MIDQSDVFGLVRPSDDVHTLGINQVSDLLADCGIHSIIADASIAGAISHPEVPENQEKFFGWVKQIGYLSLDLVTDWILLKGNKFLVVFTKLLVARVSWLSKVDQ